MKGARRSTDRRRAERARSQGGELHPGAAVGAPVYAIFPDRFCRGRGSRRKAGLRPWEGLPESPPQGRDFFGGDLAGIVERLDHVASLGVGALYLTPIFTASSNHRYDVTDYASIDPRLGGEAAFDALVTALRSRGLGLVLDGPFHHAGEHHPWFEAARASARSRRRSSFLFDSATGSPCTWRGVGQLPAWNLADPAVARLLFDGPDSAIVRWTRRGATGWRLDCANDLGPEICARITRTVRDLRAPDGVVGEVMSFASGWLDDTLDGVMNYVFRGAVIALVRGEIPPAQAAWVLDRLAIEYPLGGLLRSWTMLGSHDTPRLSTLLGEDPGRLRLTVTLQYCYPGTPLVYYGDEVGIPGGDDPDNRRTMPWSPERWNQPLLELYRRLGRLRRDHRALGLGGYLPLSQPGEPEILAFARTDPDPRQTLICVANPNARRTAARLLLPMPAMPDGLPLRDLLADRTVVCRGGFIRIELEQWDVALLRPDPSAIAGYDFYRGLITEAGRGILRST